MLHQCKFCTYHTPVKSNLRRHIQNKHGIGSIIDVLMDIMTTFNYLKRLRKQYRDLLPQLKENKDPFFNFVFEAEHFLDAKSKEKLEEYLIRDKKKNLKLEDGCDQDETNNPKNVHEVIEDIEDVFSMWNGKKEDCFKQCSKRKIQSVCYLSYLFLILF